MAKHFNGEARLVLDTGNFCTIGEHVWQVKRPSLYVASAQGRYMGVGIPLGIGAALYDPKVPTIVFTGDGGIGMFVSEMKLAVQNKLPLIDCVAIRLLFGNNSRGFVAKRLEPTSNHY